MNPESKILALKGQFAATEVRAYILNIEARAKIKSYRMPEEVVYWKWISNKVLGLVTLTSVYHWSIEGEGAPVKMFERAANLNGNQIINYRSDPSVKFLALIGIAPGAPERPQLVKGNMQLFSVDEQKSQALEAHVAAFASVKVSETTLLPLSLRLPPRLSLADSSFRGCILLSLVLSQVSESLFSFGVVMLVVLTGHKAVLVIEDDHVNIKRWVAPLVISGAVAEFKDPHLEAPDDVVLRLARLALSCTALPGVFRPSMLQVLAELVRIKQETFGVQVSAEVSGIDTEIGGSDGPLDFSAEMARAMREAVSGSSTRMP
ncbi:unnamed protein product [Closterium sp. Yama58-4]|nr:unnamed protein product [Closterium sp. Yama58-4]